MKPYLTRKEVQELLGISDRTVTRRIKKGELEFIIRDKKQLFPSEQFDNIKQEDKGVLDNVIEVLQKQLEEKDKQIEKLQIALNNQQGLTKDITDKILLLPERTSQPKQPKTRVETQKKTVEKTTKPKKKPREKREDKREKRVGFFKRIFG